ncbi:MAG: hypothetical protein ALECFALPRED_007990 [Alectoria fallacina]|uniref:Uncharacterized protein n=1 Tax=Alectoria fallacina TaxID=1903189 RepID=A0A8H3PEX5_9LECA|nr:MAG: hypothetical protein ALECFALPRED_007990 [Alectoria fallacina]
MVLIGVGSILSSVFNRRTFFAVYLLRGFLAAAADCAWARVTNPSRGLTQAQIDQVFASAPLYNEALVEMAKLRASSQILTMRGIIELFSNPGDFSSKYSRDIEEAKRQSQVINTYHPQLRAWIRWTNRNWASSGSLVCLLSVAALIRPRTIINFMGVRPSVLLHKLTAGVFIFNLYMSVATNSDLNHMNYVGGNLAAVLLWFLWLRRGRLGAIASSLRAFDRTGAQDSKTGRNPDPPQHANETGETPTEETKEDAANDKETQEGNAANNLAAASDDRAPENDNG